MIRENVGAGLKRVDRFVIYKRRIGEEGGIAAAARGRMRAIRRGL